MSVHDSIFLAKAEAFSRGAHVGQTYGVGVPYAEHLGMAAQAIYDFAPVDMTEAHFSELVAAAWLHDTLEDTKATHDLLDSLFGAYVASLVDAVTDVPGKNRRERHEKTYPLIRRFGTDAVMVKLADRIANVTYSLNTHSKSKVKMYRQEHPHFRATLYSPDDPPYMRRMWNRLDELLEWDSRTYTFKGEL